MNLDLQRLFTSKVLAGALFVSSLLMLCLFIWITWSAPSAPDPTRLLAVVTLIAVPTASPAPLASPTFDPYAPQPTATPAAGEIGIGLLVQISGTQGQGLRIRSQPGLAGQQLFLGFDTEAYTVLDGPRDLDGYTWYYLAAINDQTRTGWAASNFLTILPQTQGQP